MLNPLINDFTKILKPCTGCGKDFFVAEEFWNQKDKTMLFIINRQIVIEAETPEEAVEKTKPTEGKSISFTVTPQPKAQQPIIRTSTGSVSGSPSISGSPSR